MSLIIKLSHNGSSQEYLYHKLGPIIIGGDERCDLCLPSSSVTKALEVKVSGGNVFVKNLAQTGMVQLGTLLLPKMEETRYRDGDVLGLRNEGIEITIHKTGHLEANEPPAFFEGEFRERLDRMNQRIREKEVDLKSLSEKEDKKKLELTELENMFHRQAGEKGRLDVEVSTLRAQREALSGDIRKTREKNQNAEEKISQMKDFVKRLETEEVGLKETIVAQTLVLTNLRDERDKKSKDVDRQRVLLANLELDKLKAQDDLKKIKEEHLHQEEAIQTESGKVHQLLNSSQEALKEGKKIQAQVAHGLRQKTLLDHEVADLQEVIARLEKERADAQSKLLGFRSALSVEEDRAQKMKEEILRQTEEESNLRLVHTELRSDLARIEDKLAQKKNQLNQVEFQGQDLTRKLSTIQFELERSTLRLKDLVSEEKAQELKVAALRDDFNHFIQTAEVGKKNLAKAADEERTRVQLELTNLRREVEEETKNLNEIESRKILMEVSLEENFGRQRQMHKERHSLESDLMELKSQRDLAEGQIQNLKNEMLGLQHEKGRTERDLSALRLKLQDCETEIKAALDEARAQAENLKCQERAKVAAEKEVILSEVEAFRQKSLIEVETEYRRKEDDIHQKKQIALKESDEIIREARRIEVMITEEARERLQSATRDAQERETLAHNRVKEAQEYFKEKEVEADAIIQRARLDSRDFLKKTELELQDDLLKRKTKIKKFLQMKQETGLAHIAQTQEQHLARMRRTEEKALQKLEELKRKELKKVARLREEELSKQGDLKEAALKELKLQREKILREIHEQKNRELGDLAEKKKSMIEHINETKYRSQKTWQDELKKEKEQFERTKKDRLQNATQAVMNVFISEAGAFGEKEELLRNKVLSTLSMAIDGQNAHALKEVDQILDFNPENRKKVLPVLKKYTLRFGIPAAIALVILSDAGGTRTGLVAFTKDVLKQQQSASELYVNQQKTEWKEKHTYTPETTTAYKPNYVENVIFTKDFEKVMENEEFQNDWILRVHDFMVKNLELSEDVAINFISSEGTLVKELSLARKDLHPQFLETGMKKMNDLEKTHLGWLTEKMGPEKMAKFKSFQKEYFEKFYQEKFLSDRGVASEAAKVIP